MRNLTSTLQSLRRSLRHSEKSRKIKKVICTRFFAS
nr:MAG TPA: hypothetical protein [Caudoviricetes sp.]